MSAPALNPLPPPAPMLSGAVPAGAPRVAMAADVATPTGAWRALELSAPKAYAGLERALRALPGDVAGWDLRGVAAFDHIGAQILWRHWGGAWPAHLQTLPAQHAILDQVAQLSAARPANPADGIGVRWGRFVDWVAHLGEVLRDFVQLIGQLIFDLGRLLCAPQRGPWRDVSGHLYQIGATAMPITALVGLLIGVVLAFLSAQQLRQYGGEAFIVNLLGLSLIRELGPLLAAVLIAGRSGSAITAQIGVMRVTDELDAMRVMGIAHGYRLVLPRVLALAVVMPFIAIWTSLAALVGGMAAAWVTLDMEPAYFMSALPRVVPIINVWITLAKSVVFGVLIALIACYHGLKVEPNTQSLGRGTTSSVVTSITVVILVDALFAVMFRTMGFK